MRQIGKILSVQSNDSGMIRLTVDIYGDVVSDVIAINPSRIQHDWQPGDFVLVENWDNTSERYASPLSALNELEAQSAKFQIKVGNLVIAMNASEITITGGGVGFALAFLTALTDLKALIAAWVPVPMDGGASLKTIFANWSPTGTLVVKAE